MPRSVVVFTLLALATLSQSVKADETAILEVIPGCFVVAVIDTCEFECYNNSGLVVALDGPGGAIRADGCGTSAYCEIEEPVTDYTCTGFSQETTSAGRGTCYLLPPPESPSSVTMAVGFCTGG